MIGWRNRALVIGAALLACGLVLYGLAGNPVLAIVALLMLITAALEPIYGAPRDRPSGDHWRPTGERFVDPETGRLVTVWFNQATGERQYVDKAGAAPPRA